MTQPPPGWEPPPGWQPPPGEQPPRYPGLPPQSGPPPWTDPGGQWQADKRLYFTNPVFWGGLILILGVVLFTFFFVA